jgi:integral membrane protein
MPSLNDPIGRLRLVGYLEGASFLALLGIAMPLKHFADMPEYVRVVGTAHGVLFLLYLAAVAAAALARRLTGREVVGALIASVLPFGPFIFDARLRREERVAEPERETVA